MFVLYDYGTNAILVEPIKNFKSSTIVTAYNTIFQYLKNKGFKPEFNVLDNQASTAIKAFLTKEDSNWKFVEPKNHRVNAAERAIQTFKSHFISGLCGTDTNLPTQLWDKMLPQAQDTLNLLRTSRIDPSKSAYEILEGPYNFDRYLIAPPGTQAVIYDAPENRASWQPRGTNAWYLNPAKDHYRSAHFFVTETNACRISASAKLFPQHCDPLPDVDTAKHVNNIAEELTSAYLRLVQRKGIKTTNTIQTLRSALQHQKSPRVTVTSPTPTVEPVPSPRVNTPIQITTSNNSTAPRVVKRAPRTHKKRTRRNTPGQLPATLTLKAPIIPHILPYNPQVFHIPTPKGNRPRRSPRIQMTDPMQQQPIFMDEEVEEEPIKRRATMNIITQEAINHITHREFTTPDDRFTPECLEGTEEPTNKILDYEHFAGAGVVHPTTGVTITKYRTLARDPATRDIWTTAFGKELGMLAQGDNKTGEKGTNSLFFMSLDKISDIPSDRTVTYARVVVDYRRQKKYPNIVRITVGGNLIDYPGELTTNTEDLVT